MKILTANKVRELDKKTIASGVKSLELMERAGYGLVDILFKNGWLEGVSKVLIGAGKGNNAGDGFVAAHYLWEKNVDVEIYLLSEELKDDALTNFNRIKKDKIPYFFITKNNLKELLNKFSQVGLVIDAIFGTGFKGRIKSEIIKEIIEGMNKNSFKIVSCDVPSGINADTGEVEDICVNADLTVTFGYPKTGLVLPPARNYVGQIQVVDIGLLPVIGEEIELITASEVRKNLIKRKKDTHKKDYGHILILGGSYGFSGAPTLCCQGALRAGAGLVTCGIPQSLYPIVATKLTEAMTLPLAEKEQALGIAAFSQIESFINRRKIDIICFGPGVGTNLETAKLLEKIIFEISLPIIIDADGINLIALNKIDLKKAKAKIIITPHPGEMSRLIGLKIEKIQQDRINLTKKYAKENNLICVLKGLQTVISDGKEVWINPTGNPGMASGGMGDVLCGMIGAFCALPQRSFLKSVYSAVYIHGFAGDLLAQKKCPYGYLASELADAVGQAISMIRRNGFLLPQE